MLRVDHFDSEPRAQVLYDTRNHVFTARSNQQFDLSQMRVEGPQEGHTFVSFQGEFKVDDPPAIDAVQSTDGCLWRAVGNQ